jgi:chromosome segregation and condensation protein ScpB
LSGQDKLEEAIQNPDIKHDPAARPLLWAEQDVFFLSDKTHASQLFNELLGLLSRYESTELEDKNRRQRLLLMADQNVTLYAQVFFPCENAGEKIYVQDRSQKILLALDEWQRISVGPMDAHALRNNGLRLNPLNNTGMIHISAICIRNDVTDEPLWEQNSDRGFDACRIEGTALRLSDAKDLQILATGNDPRIILPVIPDLTDVPLSLDVWLKVSMDLDQIANMWIDHESRLEAQKKQIETLIARYEQSDLELTKIRGQLDERVRENNNILDLLDQRTKKWEKKNQRLEEDLKRQERLSREYFAVLAGVEQELAAARDREETSKSMVKMLERDFQSLLGSVRWRVGDTLTRIGEVLLLRKKQPLSVDAMRKIFDQFKSENTIKRHPFSPIRESFDDPYAVKMLKKWVRQLHNDFEALKNSKRWRLGNALLHGLEIITCKSGQAMAIDHLEKIFKDYEKMSNSHAVEDLKTLQALMKRPQKDFQAISHSMRWKVGDSIFSFIDSLLLRGKKPTVMDHIHAVYQEYDAWRKDK